LPLFDSAAHAAEIEAWRRRRVERLTSEDGWLSLTGLFWLEPGDNAVGADPASEVRLPASKSPPRVGSIRLADRLAVFEPAPCPGLEVDGIPAMGPMPLETDAAEFPTVVAIGTVRFHVVERGGRFAVRVRDTDNPARRELRPIDFFPVSAAWRCDARFEPYAPPKKIPVTSILGTVEDESSPGAVVFSAGGHELRLDPIFERGEMDYWIIFGDRTNGVDTYGGGRFVYVPPPCGGRTVLDFNKAYNPPCVFTPHSTCPLPPPQNRLAIRVEAGEKRYGA
jgi:uncharacterized protein (DUF1684 family)